MFNYDSKLMFYYLNMGGTVFQQYTIGDKNYLYFVISK